ncbi:MAG: YcxB family protein [Verrucomicrobia bacterium]|nr:YcxB family protein [Verrucomicrobiota bacterium]
MELQYELTTDDSMAYQKHSARRLSAAFRSWPVRLGTVGVFLAGYVVFRLIRPEGTPISQTAKEYFLVMLLALALSIATSMAKRVGAARFLRDIYAGAPRSISVSLALRPDGIASQSDSAVGLLPWHSIRGIEEGEQHIFFLSGFTAIEIIPKRAFRDEQHMRQFLDEMARLRAAAQTQSQG